MQVAATQIRPQRLQSWWRKIDADDPLGGVPDRNLFHPEWVVPHPCGPVYATLLMATGTFRRDGSVGAPALLTAKIFP